MSDAEEEDANSPMETKRKRIKLERSFFIIKMTEIQDSWRKSKSQSVKKKATIGPEQETQT